jgi:hypothetical protein
MIFWDIPIKNGDFPWLCNKLPEGIWQFLSSIPVMLCYVAIVLLETYGPYAQKTALPGDHV